MYRCQYHKLNDLKIGGIGFHKDINFDDGDILIYPVGGDARMEFMPHSRFGNHCLFSIYLPAGTVTRFEGTYKTLHLCCFHL